MRGLRAALAPALALSGGVVWGLTFGRSPWSIAPWLALAPLVVLLGRPRAGGLGFLFGLASWTVGLSWIPATLIQFGGLPRPVALLCLLLLASYLALFQLAFAKLGRGLWLAGGAAALLGLPALWVALEWLRAHFLGGFPWNLAAYSWIAVPGALPLSAWIGAYGVSFVVVFANVSLAQALVHRRLAPAALGILLPLLALGLAGRASYRDAVSARGAHLEANDFGRPVRIVQPNVPVRTSYQPAQAYADYRRTLDLAAESCEPGALVLLPESALWPFSFDRDAQLKADLAALTARGCTLVFNGEKRGQGEVVYNSAYLLSSTGAVTRYDKRHLVPFGEYVPFASVLGWVGRMSRTIGEYSPGEKITLLPWGGERLGMAICYEVVYPEEVAEITRAGATLLVTITNDAWYGDTAAPEQHLRAARFRAAENRRTLLRAGLTGISALVGPDGSERERVPLLSAGVIRSRVWGRRELTPYARAPWLPPLLASLGAAFAIIARRLTGRTPP